MAYNFVWIKDSEKESFDTTLENAYQKIAVCNILKNLFMRPFRLVESAPFDYLGNMTGVNYNYIELPSSNTYRPLVLKSKVTEINLDGEFLDMKKQFAFVDFDISTWNGNI